MWIAGAFKFHVTAPCKQNVSARLCVSTALFFHQIFPVSGAITIVVCICSFEFMMNITPFPPKKNEDPGLRSGQLLPPVVVKPSYASRARWDPFAAI